MDLVNAYVCSCFPGFHVSSSFNFLAAELAEQANNFLSELLAVVQDQFT